MANLEKVAESLSVKLELIKFKQMSIDSNDLEKTVGHKRRAWLPDTKKGSIDPIYQPHLSTPFDQPLSVTGSIKGAYKPLNISLQNLRSNPLKIAQYLFELSNHDPEKITGKLTQSEIMKHLEISRDSARTGLRFLLKNTLVKRVAFQAGKAGWSKYKLKNELFEELAKTYQKGSIQKGVINSSSNNYKNTTTYKPLLDWENIDISPLENIGFNKKHLLQLMRKNLPEIVQESINHFAYGLLYNLKTQKYADPLSVLIGVLRKGEPWVEANYKSSQEISLEKTIENKKKQKEKISALEAELLKIEFEEWYVSLTDDKKKELTKGIDKNSMFSVSAQEKIEKGYLLEYFKKNIQVNEINN